MKDCNLLIEAEYPQMEIEEWKAHNKRLSTSSVSIDSKYSKVKKALDEPLLTSSLE